MVRVPVKPRAKSVISPPTRLRGEPRGVASSLPQIRLPPRFLRRREERWLRAVGSLRSLFSPSISTAHAAPGSSALLPHPTKRKEVMTNSTTNRPDIYSKITDKIVADLEEGVRP